MTNASLLLEQQLNALREAYAQQLPDKMKQIENSWRQLVLGQWSSDGLKTLYRQVHGLTGSGATFGFERVSEAALAAEMCIKPLLESSSVPPDAVLLKLNAHLGELRKVCAHPDHQPQPGERSGKLHQFVSSRRV